MGYTRKGWVDIVNDFFRPAGDEEKAEHVRTAYLRPPMQKVNIDFIMAVAWPRRSTVQATPDFDVGRFVGRRHSLRERRLMAPSAQMKHPMAGIATVN